MALIKACYALLFIAIAADIQFPNSIIEISTKFSIVIKYGSVYRLTQNDNLSWIWIYFGNYAAYTLSRNERKLHSDGC